MRGFIMLMLCFAVIGLEAVPVARTIINTRVYQASASENRCVISYHNSSVFDDLTHMTLWDTSNPVYPRQGYTIVSNFTWGQYHFRFPTVHGNLLFYMDSFVIRMVDISNIDVPIAVGQLQVTVAQCFAVFDHYLAVGTADGTVLTFDVSNPAQPVYVSTAYAGGAVFQMWMRDGLLGLSCGFSINQSARLLQWSEPNQCFVELASAPNDIPVTYVGAMDGYMVYSLQDGRVRFFSFDGSSPPALALELSGGYNLRQVLADADCFYALSEDNCLRVWQLNPSHQTVLTGHFDLSHLSSDRGVLFEIHDDRLIYSVSDMICMELDVSNLAADPSLIDKYVTGIPINNLAIPEGGNSIYYMNEYRFSHVKMDSSGRLETGVDIQDVGYGRRLLAHRRNLFLICGTTGDLWLKIFSFEDPESPSLIWSQPVTYANIFRVKDETFYLGSILEVDKYHLDAGGLPVWSKTLSHYLADVDYDVMFLDMDSYMGIDYGVGVYGDLFSGYVPVLVYWLPNGTPGILYPPYYLFQSEVVNGWLILTGNGINVLDLSCGAPRLDNIQQVNTHTKGVESQLYIGDRYLLQSYEATNQIWIYDLANPRNPQHIHTIYQGHSTLAMGLIGNRLVCANGVYGIEVYQLPFTLESADPELPEVMSVSCWPNPTVGEVNIGFRLKSPGSVCLEIYNIRGQKVHSRLVGDARAGENTIAWDGRDQDGSDCAAGVYLLKISGPGISLTGKVLRR